MKKISFSIFILLFLSASAFSQVLPLWDKKFDENTPTDWLIHSIDKKANAFYSIDKKNIILYNGLVKRSFRITPNVACTDFKNMSNAQQLLRAIRPEAIVTIEGVPYEVGGLHGQSEKAYLQEEWIDGLTKGLGDFVMKSVEVTDIKPSIQWKKNTWGSVNKFGTGKMISFTYDSPFKNLYAVEVVVHYEIYDGIPLIVKWVSVVNNKDRPLIVNRIVNESLGLVEEESAVVGSPDQMKKQHGIYVETNYAFNNAMRYDISDQTTHWLTDSTYTSQVNYNYQIKMVQLNIIL